MNVQFFPDHDEFDLSTPDSGIVFLGLETQLVHGLDERAVTEVLNFPEIDRERESSGEFQKLSETLRAVEIGGLAGESIGLFFQKSPPRGFPTAKVKISPRGGPPLS